MINGGICAYDTIPLKNCFGCSRSIDPFYQIFFYKQRVTNASWRSDFISVLLYALFLGWMTSSAENWIPLDTWFGCSWGIDRSPDYFYIQTTNVKCWCGGPITFIVIFIVLWDRWFYYNIDNWIPLKMVLLYEDFLLPS